MFPGANAQVYYNEEGEPLGWDYPSDDPYDPDDWYDQAGWEDEEFLYAEEYFDVCGCGDEEYGACRKDTCRAEAAHYDGDMKTAAQWDALAGYTGKETS